MCRSFMIVVVLALFASPFPAVGADGAPEAGAARTFILDGSVVHDVGAVHLNITNWGLIGSRPGVNAPYSEAPSLEYPAGSDVDHLYAAGLWVGGIVDGVVSVSEGQFTPELQADPDDPLDVIYASRENQPHSRRYPMPNADDDRDGLEDEDPIDGRDNDGDGRIDEDYAAIGRQYFRAVMRDDTPLSQELFPDHSPMGIEVVQESFQWKDERFGEFVGFRLTITNHGDSMIEQPFVGMLADFDIGNAENDLARPYDGAATAFDGSLVNLTLGHVHSADDTGAFAGVVIAGPDLTASSLQIFSGNQPFNRGGDPTNDAERYQALSAGSFDSGNASPEDVRVLIAAGPFDDLAPGESAVVDLALVVGETEADLIRNAANAVRLASGARFDRDGDASNGDEFHVPWIEQKGKAREKGRKRVALKASPNPFNPRVEFAFDLPEDGVTQIDVYDTRGRLVATVLDEHLGAGTGQVIWDGVDSGGRAVSSGVYFVQLRQRELTETIRAVVVR